MCLSGPAFLSVTTLFPVIYLPSEFDPYKVPLLALRWIGQFSDFFEDYYGPKKAQGRPGLLILGVELMHVGMGAICMLQ